MIPNLRRLICVRHLMKRDEMKLADLLPKTDRNIGDRKRSSSEIIKDIYGSRIENYYEYGLVESMDPDDFNVKIESLKERWESLCPEFFNLFNRNRKSLFIESVIQSARIDTDSTGLYYQNDIESLHAVEKRKQNFKKEDIVTAMSNIQSIIKREDNEEIRAIYGAGNYVLAPEFKKFQVLSHKWHSWGSTPELSYQNQFQSAKASVASRLRKKMCLW